MLTILFICNQIWMPNIVMKYHKKYFQTKLLSEVYAIQLTTSKITMATLHLMFDLYGMYLSFFGLLLLH